MSIFKFGKNKKESVRYDGEASISEETSKENLDIIYDEIVSKGNGAKRVEDGIWYDNTGLHISCVIQRMSGNEGRYSSEMLFIINHELFDEPLCEYVAGLGDCEPSAMRSGAEQFVGVILLPVLSAFGCTGENFVKAEVDGETYVFHRACTETVYSIGAENAERRNHWEIIEKEIPEYLGTKNAYWIKIYACCIDGAPNCEVRINGAVFPELTKKVDEYVASWSNQADFHSEKSFFLLIKEEKSKNEPDSELVKELTMETIDNLLTAQNEDEEKKARAELYLMCNKDISLLWELETFTPEIYTFIAYNLKNSDSIKICRQGKPDISVKKSQIRTYGYIEQGVCRYIREKNPSWQKSLQIMCRSAVFNALNNAVNAGSKVEDLYFPEMIYNAPDTYKVR